MRTPRVLFLSALAVIALAAPTLRAQNGNGAPNGAHYNLNLIGVTNPKTQPLTNSDRHTIFVGLGKNGAKAVTNIYLVPGPFDVCDGNGFDTATDCNGNPINGSGMGAVFQLPCNTDPTVTVPCSSGMSYDIFIRALGKPTGLQSTITTCATEPDGAVVCSTSNNVTLSRTKGKQSFTDVTDALTTLVDTANGNTYALFTGDFINFFWQYDNNGLKLAQVRFYLGS